MKCLVCEIPTKEVTPCRHPLCNDCLKKLRPHIGVRQCPSCRKDVSDKLYRLLLRS